MREQVERESDYTSDSSQYSNDIDNQVDLKKLEYGVNSKKCTIN